MIIIGTCVARELVIQFCRCACLYIRLFRSTNNRHALAYLFYTSQKTSSVFFSFSTIMVVIVCILDNDSSRMNHLRVLFIFVLLSVHGDAVKDKFVSITLDAKWLDTPLHQEAR